MALTKFDWTKKSNLVSLGFLAAVCAVAFLPGPRRAIWIDWETHDMSARNPLLSIVPSELQDQSAAAWHGQVVHALQSPEYTFEVPQDQLAPDTYRSNRAIGGVRLKDGVGIALMRQDRIVPLVHPSVDGAEALLNDQHGEGGMRSDAKLQKVILNTVPNDVGFLPSKTQGPNFLFLILKGSLLGDRANDGFFRVTTNEFSGYQRGVAGKSESVFVDLYDQDSHVEFLFSATPGTKPFSQADINRVVRSLHRLP